VGCVALDVDGRVAVAVSTGGLSGARPGRIGDTPLPGCGFYADSSVGGVAATGEGESISRTLLSARAVLAMEAGAAPQAAVEAALRQLARVGGEAGLIAVDRSGRLGWSHSGDQFAIGWARGPSPILHIEIGGLEPTHG
jgi:beta-aspartyl-peptidase (threonine type)